MKPSLLLRLLLAVSLTLWLTRVTAQNVISTEALNVTAPLITLTAAQIDQVLNQAIAPRRVDGAESRRVQEKLEQHLEAYLDGFPWLPFHHTLGISGYEAYFNHPDEMFYMFSLALPQLSPELAHRLKTFADDQLRSTPPYALNGWPVAGQPRERYSVPDHLRWRGNPQATSALGVYSFWAWCHAARDHTAATNHWNAIRERMGPLLAKPYGFDLHALNSSRNESEILNGDAAGLLGLVRLARWNHDAATEKLARERFSELLEVRINLERVNPQILEKSTASKSLHVSKLARYNDLVPEIGESLRLWSSDCGAKRLRVFRESRNGWHLAFGDRLIGGENYTNPAHFPRALFTGAVLVEGLPSNQVLTFVDIPWCAGDLYFMEKCALALWTASGREWAEIPKN